MCDESRLLDLELAILEIKQLLLVESLDRTIERQDTAQTLLEFIHVTKSILNSIKEPSNTKHAPQKNIKTKTATQSLYQPPVKSDKRVQEYVYLIRTEDYDQVKIGKANNPKQRLRELQTGSFKKLVLHQAIPSKNAYLLENKLHLKFNEYRLYGEWFKGWEVIAIMDLLLKNTPNLDYTDLPNPTG